MSLVDYVTQTVWGLEPRVHGNLVSLVLAHASGARVSEERIAEVVAARESAKERELPSGYVNRDGVGVVPVSGVIARHARQVNGASQPRGTSLEQIQRDLSAAFADDTAHSVMLAIDSPGGSVDGIVDFTDRLRAMRAQSTKPVVAHVAGNAASLAYWIAAQADQVIATRGSRVGSIGARATLIDDHRRLEEAGLSVVHVGSTPGKVEGPQMGSAIGPSEIAAVKSELDAWHAKFVDAVATGRRVPADVAAEWAADSQMFDATDAKAMGLIDAVGTEESAIESLRSAAEKRRAAQPVRGERKMTAQNEGGAVAVAPANPTSAHDLRAAYPEAVQQIEREAMARAVTSERERVATIAGACKGRGEPVLRAAIEAIQDGRDAVGALTAMLDAQASAPVTQTIPSATANTPTMSQIRLATSQAQPLGSAPLPERPPAAALSPKPFLTLRKQWDALSADQRGEFNHDFASYAAANGGISGRV